jgi:Transglutaminase-like superfamily
MEQKYKLAHLVYYDDYDTKGYLLDIKQNILLELDECETRILSTILSADTLTQVVALFNESRSPQTQNKIDEGDIHALLKRLSDQKLLETQTRSTSVDPHAQYKSVWKDEAPPTQSCSVTMKQRLVGTGHMLLILAELCKREEGIYKAHQYIWQLKQRYNSGMMSESLAVTLVYKEYWFYRLITGLVERRVAHILGQVPGNEGLCMIRALSLCAYVISLGIPANIVFGRPKYGTRGGFKIHVWVALNGIPLNENPNIGDGYRILAEFPLPS